VEILAIGHNVGDADEIRRPKGRSSEI